MLAWLAEGGLGSAQQVLQRVPAPQVGRASCAQVTEGGPGRLRGRGRLLRHAAQQVSPIVNKDRRISTLDPIVDQVSASDLPLAFILSQDHTLAPFTATVLLMMYDKISYITKGH